METKPCLHEWQHVPGSIPDKNDYICVKCGKLADPVTY